MLVLSRKIGEEIVIGSNVTVKVIDCAANRVRVGIEAPRQISIHRSEIYDRVKEEMSQGQPG